MSQHHFMMKNENGEFGILMGWDRPLQGFFCVVNRIDVDVTAAEDDDDEESGSIYCNLDDMELASRFGMSHDIDYFIAKLKTLGLRIPENMVNEILNDRDCNAGNRYVVYDESGKSTV